MILASLVALVAVGFYWEASSFSALPSILPVTLAGLLGALGLQTLFAGFLLAVLGGNEAQFYPAQPAE